jgi:hypothetical protein
VSPDVWWGRKLNAAWEDGREVEQPAVNLGVAVTVPRLVTRRHVPTG